ncbi:MAG: FAD-dependent oxidoreductase [Candidatus Thiodiazotropha sp. (ex Monitilora ramsayi)]|nr:FAD-dependent oxidoreductase [Candidatus Thiodiazotropha sp. (ex Monitilora ramsayi)]
MKHLILGNGPAGVVAAETLRHSDTQCEILMAGSEDEPPYSRMAIPYLLEENIDESGTYLRKSPDHFDSLGISQLRGRAVSLDINEHQVLFQDGHSETYDRLLIATGSHPVRPPIPGIDLPNVHTCWTLDDARAIASLTKPGTRVLQLGAGFIGCIILEALANRGVKLTVVEMGDRMVPRMMTPKAGGMIKRWVENKGIQVRTSAGVERIDETEKGGPLRVSLNTGETLECDVVIVSAGVVPNIGFLEGTPLHVAKGILVNDAMQTSVPEIYAAGDVAEAPDLFTGAHLVSAIQPNAADQARVAAINMAGGQTHLKGVLAINVLDTLGLISTSFGQWEGVNEREGGSGAELIDEEAFRYLSLQFKDDVMIGATSIGWTEHVGVLRGLIQGQVRLGERKQQLMHDPTRFMAAYLGAAQAIA